VKHPAKNKTNNSRILSPCLLVALRTTRHTIPLHECDKGSSGSNVSAAVTSLNNTTPDLKNLREKPIETTAVALVYAKNLPPLISYHISNQILLWKFPVSSFLLLLLFLAFGNHLNNYPITACIDMHLVPCYLLPIV
jgi:hypothetical protein